VHVSLAFLYAFVYMFVSFLPSWQCYGINVTVYCQWNNMRSMGRPKTNEFIRGQTFWKIVFWNKCRCTNTGTLTLPTNLFTYVFQRERQILFIECRSVTYLQADLRFGSSNALTWTNVITHTITLFGIFVSHSTYRASRATLVGLVFEHAAANSVITEPAAPRSCISFYCPRLADFVTVNWSLMSESLLEKMASEKYGNSYECDITRMVCNSVGITVFQFFWQWPDYIPLTYRIMIEMQFYRHCVMAITKCFASLTEKLMESEIVNFWIWLVVLFPLKNLNVKKENP